MTYIRALAAPIAALLILAGAAAAKDVPQTLTIIDSVVTDSADLHGNVVLVDFWASWCRPCRSSFPWMNQLEHRFAGKGLRIVTVNLDKDPALARKFLSEMNSSLPVVYDSTGSLAKVYNLDVMPTSFIYGRDGKLREKHKGFEPKDTDSLESLIYGLLKEESPK